MRAYDHETPLPEFFSSTRELSSRWLARGSQADDANAATLPDSIGPYRVLKRLGTGGMGDVFLAFDETLGREIALKRIRRDRLSDAEVRRRFEIEVRVTAILQHPSIVPVYEYLRAGGETFYTMRPIEGVTLHGLLEGLRDKESRLGAEWTTARLVRLFLQVTNAVAFAHANGVIHRDLKPGNIMVGPFEEVLVLDWGMAKFLEDDKREARSGVSQESLGSLTADTASYHVAGTPAYMAPEQLEGKPATFKNDIFSLGVILYELLAQRLLWQAESFSELSEAMGRLRKARLVCSRGAAFCTGSAGSCCGRSSTTRSGGSIRSAASRAR